ncbi:MAG TPA: ABC transporter substrate-binding protein [Anaerolineae bacterium]
MTVRDVIQAIAIFFRPRGRPIAVLLLVVVVAAIVAWRTWPRDATFERVKERGVLRVGLDPSFPPFENLDPATGKPVGFDVDLTTALAAQMGVKAEIVPAGFDELVDAVAAHRVDAAISALPVFPWRSRDVSFSSPYVEAGVVLAARPGAPITGTAGLAGRRVAVEWGSEGDAQARALQKSSAPGLVLVQREDAGQALAAVAAGEADAAIVDAISLALHNRDGARLITIGAPLRSDPYVVVVPHDAPALLNAIDAGLAQLQANGTLAALHARWFGEQ